MNRAQVYAKIVKYNLQETVKTYYGKNYTNVSTADLLNVVKNHEYFMNKPTTSNSEKDTLTLLIELLYKKHILCKSEYDSLKA